MGRTPSVLLVFFIVLTSRCVCLGDYWGLSLALRAKLFLAFLLMRKGLLCAMGSDFQAQRKGLLCAMGSDFRPGTKS